MIWRKKMSKTFSESEKHILSMLSVGKKLILDKTQYIVIKSGKPTCSSGEPKTDIYIKAKNLSCSAKDIELKISYKQDNADFLENKMTAERAEQILGTDWKNIIIKSTEKLREEFEKRPLIYKEGYRRTEKGCFTLGWKFELLRIKSGELSEKLDLTRAQVRDVYSGSNISEDKKNSFIDNERVNNSGIANYILRGDIDNFNNTQDIIDNMISIDEYIKEYPDIFFACKALNYRSFKDKWDGDRPLAVYIKWDLKNDKLYSKIKYDNPLLMRGNEVVSGLKRILEQLKIKNTKDINSNNCYNSEIIYQ